MRGRRLVGLLVVGVAVLLLVACLQWVKWERHRDTFSPQLREVRIAVPGLTREVDLLQVSDLGSSEFGRGQRQLADLLQSRRFDAVLLTGDMYGGGGYQPVWALAEVLKPHSGRIWYLPGNHDTSQVAQGLAQRGVPSLPEGHALPFASLDPAGREVALVYGRNSQDIDSARGYGQRLLVVASHTPPDERRLAAGARLGTGTHLYVAGHTHGGQIRLPFFGAVRAPLSWEYEERAPARGTEVAWLPELRGRFVDGLYTRSGQRVFVSRGLEKFAGGQQRFLARAEIVWFRFVPEVP